MTVVSTQIHSGSPERTMDARAETVARTFDGVICFGGEDWWYHNRGHYDMQIMRELSARVPVLYINSIGMRVPRVTEGRMFFKRIARKWRSLRRGLVRVRANFTVFSPTILPGRSGLAISRPLLAAQVRKAARKLSITRPLVWVACPPAARVVDRIDAAALVYQRTDRFEDFKDVDRALIAAYDRKLKRDALFTVFCSTHLFEAEREQCRQAVFVDHGVDFDMFANAGDNPRDEPDDLRPIPHPRAGFIGGIDIHTFDPELFCEVARTLPDVQFVMVGGCTLPDDWCTEPNVHLLGQKPYTEVARYMAGCDVLIMPWNASAWIKACNPVKLKEYLATGRGIVSTWFDEVQNNYDGYVRVARDAQAFAGAIRAAIAQPPDPEDLRQRVRDETWRRKGDLIVQHLADRGVEPEPCRTQQT